MGAYVENEAYSPIYIISQKSGTLLNNYYVI
jgi:hypothetical protein